MLDISEAKTETDFIWTVLLNGDQFDWSRYQNWLYFQPKALQKLAKICPPTGVYRLVSDGRPCAVSGYKRMGAENAAIAIIVYGEESPQFVDEKQIRDVTQEEKARLKKTAV